MIFTLLLLCGYPAVCHTERIVMKAALSKLLPCAIVILVFLPFTCAHAAEPDAAACRQYADSYAGGQSKGQMLGGAVIGTVAGAGIGAIFSGAGAGAVIGGGLGAIGGGARKSAIHKKAFEDAFIECMAGRVPSVQ